MHSSFRLIAASAIVALQERNQVLMQAKTSAIDGLVENRSRWAIGLWQNHGTADDSVDVAGESVRFVGTDYVGRKFNFTVESGSTTPRTSLQNQELAFELFKLKAVDQKAILEVLNFPNWKEILQRTAGDQLGQALQILVGAGLPDEVAAQIKNNLTQQQLQQDRPEPNTQTTTG